MTTPVVLQQISPSVGYYQGLAIDDTWVYFGQGSYGVRRIAKTGGLVEDFARGDGSVAFLTLAPLSSPVVNGDAVYWVSDNEGVLRVARSAFSAATPAIVAPVPTKLSGSLRSLGIDGTNLYFSDVGDNVAIAPLAGNPPAVVSLGTVGFVDFIVGDSAGVFFANASVGIFGAGPGGANPTLIAPAFGSGLALDPSYVYWLDYEYGLRRIGRTATDAGTATTVASTSVASGCVAVDDQSVYWGENGSADGGVSTLRDAPKGGGDVRVLATGIAPTVITTDATCIYYLDGQHVMRVSKWAGRAP